MRWGLRKIGVNKISFGLWIQNDFGVLPSGNKSNTNTELAIQHFITMINGLSVAKYLVKKNFDSRPDNKLSTNSKISLYSTNDSNKGILWFFSGINFLYEGKQFFWLFNSIFLIYLQ